LFLEATQALNRIFDRVDPFLKDDLLRGMFELLAGKPTPMRQRPMAASAVNPCAAAERKATAGVCDEDRQPPPRGRGQDRAQLRGRRQVSTRPSLGVISTAGLRVMKLRPAVIASLPNHAAANVPNHANDAIGALRALGYSKGEAASAVASASAALGPQADTSALVKTALRLAGT
jgi:RuvA, C-terminal domain